MLNNELFILSALTISILSILVMLLVYLTFRKTIENKNRQTIENYKKKYNPLIFMIINEGSYSRKLTPETALQKKAIEELLTQYTKILEGEDEKQRLTELAGMYLTEYYQKRLNSKKWSTRMNTLYHIEDFNLNQFSNDVYMLTKKKQLSHQELLHILRILALFQYEPIVELITKHYRYLSEFEYRYILIRLSKQNFDQFVLNFHKSGFELQKAILNVISIKRELGYLAFLENVFSSYSGEVRLRALKALADIGFVKDSSPYLEFLYSEKWEERMIAAKLIGSLMEEKGIPRLIELLHDPTWWVRSQAGQAICQFANGYDILRSVLETSKDAFAKDMAWEWLHKGV
ncbi:HEAT repeat domain-containing protein [Neobacillus sp.]|uniref:HEAT repeat domain-containing protein n=1 Tax=Neobacillus sp. TaxID=2675273 RepID=UPI00289C5A02|nr:HEAT repeat domain-containing protein [Neobacillus sp.]